MINLGLNEKFIQTAKVKMLVAFHTRSQPLELEQFLNSLSASLRLKVQAYVITRVLKNN